MAKNTIQSVLFEEWSSFDKFYSKREISFVCFRSHLVFLSHLAHLSGKHAWNRGFCWFRYLWQVERANVERERADRVFDIPSFPSKENTQERMSVECRGSSRQLKVWSSMFMYSFSCWLNAEEYSFSQSYQSYPGNLFEVFWSAVHYFLVRRLLIFCDRSPSCPRPLISW